MCRLHLESHSAQDLARLLLAPVQRGAVTTVLEEPSGRGPAASGETRLVNWEGAWHAEKEGSGGGWASRGGKGKQGWKGRQELAMQGTGGQLSCVVHSELLKPGES